MRQGRLPAPLQSHGLITARPPQPVLTDGTILCDAFTLDDLEAHLAGEDDEHRRWFEFPRPSTQKDVRAAIERWTAEWINGGDRIAFAVRDAHTLALLGGCELRRDGGHAQLSYWTFPPHRRRGVASTALELVCDFAAAELAVTTFEARVDPANLASRRVAEKAGFVAQGTMHEDSGAERVRYLHRVLPSSG